MKYIQDPKQKRRFISGLIFLVIMTMILLEELGLGFIENDRAAGISVYKEEQVAPGLNLFCSRDEPRAFLQHPDGRIIHEWHTLVGGSRKRGWHHVELLPSGNLFAIVKDKGLLKLNKNSDRIWQSPGGFHHDLDITPDETILILERRLTDITWQGKTFPVLGEFIVFLSPSGERLNHLSLTEILLPLVPDAHLNAAREFAKTHPRKELTNNTKADIFHMNTIELLRSDLMGIPAFSGVLLSAREIDTIFIIDLKTGELVWSFGPGILDHQHQPTFLPNGNILIFDNGFSRGFSRVVEVNPQTQEVVRTTDRVQGKSFFSIKQGGSQWLSNRNLLLVSGERAVALEITPTNKVVWAYKNPGYHLVRSRTMPLIERRGTIYRMERIEDPARLSFLNSPTPPIP
ncbi:MAG: arylsulfotransferase family protein, partial [Bdellovibrionota bacterium]